MPQLLLIESAADPRAEMKSVLAARGARVFAANGLEAAREALSFERFDAAIFDAHEAGSESLAFCEYLVSEHPQMPVIILTASGSLEFAVDAMRAGVTDFLVKPVDGELLTVAVDRALEKTRLKQEVRQLRARMDLHSPFEDAGLIGDSPAMMAVKSLIERVGRTQTSVLITGESGTGKEVVARLLHDRGPRSGRSFVALNMTALPESLLESQLFGHVKGAFTDASTAQPGLFLQAHGGTLFLDEVGDMPIALQPKLLRVIQERRVRPLGGNKEIPFDVRVIAATHRDLEMAIEEGRFREDLYYRLNVVQVDLPSLRERGNDILALAQHFISMHASAQGVEAKPLSPAAARALMGYPWPGNVRELSNCMERGVALAEQDRIEIDDFPQRIATGTQPRKLLSTGQVPAAEVDLMRLEEVERAHILKVFGLCKGNKARTAQILGIDRKTLYRKLAQAGFVDRDFSDRGQRGHSSSSPAGSGASSSESVSSGDSSEESSGASSMGSSTESSA
jgi:DNA-binding NtrC family response regulator